MKKPTKAQLYEQIAELEKMQQKAYNDRNREKIKRWNELLPAAYAVCRKQLNAVFPNAVTMLHFEHVDEGGYWFTFQLINDDRAQTYTVRHHEVGAAAPPPDFSDPWTAFFEPD